MSNELAQKNTESLFNAIIRGLEKGELEAVVQSKCICVDAYLVQPEDYGKEHIVWSHGQVEKTITLGENMVLIKTLGADGKPILDDAGHENIYDMKADKFAKRYKLHENGHYVQDGTPMLTVSLPDGMIPEEGVTLLPPNWGGYEGTLMKDGLVMFPFDPSLSIKANIEAIKEQGFAAVDWYPNNESQTYSPCDKNGIFADEQLRKTFGQSTPVRK